MFFGNFGNLDVSSLYNYSHPPESQLLTRLLTRKHISVLLMPVAFYV